MTEQPPRKRQPVPRPPPGTPGNRLDELLAERQVSKKRLGELLKAGYRTVHNWTLDMGFNPRNQREVALLFDLPENYFVEGPDSDPRPPAARTVAPALRSPAVEMYPSLRDFFEQYGHDVNADERYFCESQRFAFGDPGALWWPKMLLEYRRLVHLRNASRVALEAAKEAQQATAAKDLDAGYLQAEPMTAERLARMTGEPVRVVERGKMVGQKFFADP